MSSYLSFFNQTSPIHRLLLTVGFILSIPTSAYSAMLPNFESSYYVNVYGVELGKATHRFNCKQNDCTLISRAKPTGLAALLFKDSSVETIQLTQTDNALVWKQYHKLGLAYKDGQKTEKITTLLLDSSSHQVFSVEQNKQWPSHPYLYDPISIAYAIQYYKLNHEPINTLDFYLQQKNTQEKLNFNVIDQAEYVPVDFDDNELDSLKYTFKSKSSQIDVWLLPHHDYFPVKIRITNKEEDRTLTLNLAELPKRL